MILLSFISDPWSQTKTPILKLKSQADVLDAIKDKIQSASPAFDSAIVENRKNALALKTAYIHGFFHTQHFDKNVVDIVLGYGISA